jgi:DnaD/phage-associated family protein
MTDFQGFTSSETFTQVPDSLFRLMNEIDDLSELKATLYVLWRIEHTAGRFRYICQSEIEEDGEFMRGLSAAVLSAGLEKAVQRGTLIRVENDSGGFYVLNSPRGRVSAEALRNGQWRESASSTSRLPREIPNIYKLYEENIGPLTPLMADALKDAERDYPAAWLAEAFSIAVTRNKRNWKYIEAILKRWKDEGYEGKNRQDAGKDPGRYSKSEFSDFLD